MDPTSADLAAIAAVRDAICTVKFYLSCRRTDRHPSDRLDRTDWPANEVVAACRVPRPRIDQLVSRITKLPDDWLTKLLSELQQATRIPDGDNALILALSQRLDSYEQVLWPALQQCMAAVENAIPQGDVAPPADSSGDKVKESPPADAGRDERIERPKAYCFGWPQILDALELKNNDENRNRVRRLNDSEQHPGPITIAGQGAQPTAEHGKLIAWWNSLEERHNELAARQQDKQAITDAQYAYGHDGTVSPAIGGSVKRRRRTKKGPPQ